MASSRAGSPIPREVADELERVVARWHQLPLDHALSRAPAVRDVVQSLADEVAGCRRRPPSRVPDLGPATLMHQLQVMVFDLFAGRPDTSSAWVTERLSGIRRSL
ncbi:hypothetical protein BA895_08440 [Humibacillus sp. DSM 29435]|uniref:hypothetical protein n=1 Tax=Humibacillus sp. DSM 29435 TaxID=1869167 RepID=UPI0008729912|nr:hypothetical protein [Humibacillus sp. DSM 29435]OFE14713.1 hypothetical protein BA895_08440 [Humibacillus sp. DSM 29435]